MSNHMLEFEVKASSFVRGVRYKGIDKTAPQFIIFT